MNIGMVSRNVVLIANNFNLSIFREHWFINEKLLLASDIDSTISFFTPNFVQIANSKYNITIQPNQLKMDLTPNGSFKEFGIISKIVNKLPFIPYVALGVNIEIYVEDFDSYLGSSLFFDKENKLYKDIDVAKEEPMFGIYFSKKFDDLRMKLIALPVTANIPVQADPRRYLHFQFNYHKDLNAETAVNDIGELIAKAEYLSENSMMMLKNIFPND